MKNYLISDGLQEIINIRAFMNLDLIEEIKKKLGKRKKKENRKANVIMRKANTTIVRLNRRKNRLDSIKKEKHFDIRKFRKLLKQIEKDKKLQLKAMNQG